ncbi:MAG: hypothetical protein H6617_03580 [Bdellovibrionaceae bacterium]|nr:hypothetical protein [Bdellovibrionales bacterium]MCB9253740.1 hypothetical protein [Pseudobdellovibrionaceae bacterium]
MIRKLGLCILVLSSLLAPLVFAEKAKTKSRRSKGDYVIEKRSDGTTVKYKKKNTYDFEGADIEGLFKRPSGSYISNIQGVKGRTIIRIRKNFDAEVVDSARILH